MKKILGLFIIYLLLITPALSKDLRFAQVTDVRWQKDNTSLQKVVNDINKQKNIDFVIFTGDNIAKPTQENLDSFLNTAKKLKCPFYAVIGDKDVNKRKNLSKKQYAEYLHKHIARYKPKTPNYIFEKKGVVFIVPDGSKDVIPDTIGYYKDDVLEWIDANLDLYSTKPVIILQHFPIVPPAEKEAYYTYKADKYLDMLKKHNNVKAVIAGHFGVNNEQNIDGIEHISTAPAPCYRIIDFIDFDTPTSTLWAEIKVAE